MTDFERGFPIQSARTDDGREPDPWVWDDQSVIVHVRDRGLVVLSGCGGGLHLSGGIFEPIIGRQPVSRGRGGAA